MPDNLLRLYPSGFYGSAVVKSTAAIDYETNRQQMFNITKVSEPNPYAASLEVSGIWQAVNGNLPEVKTFEFQERVLRCASAAFGCQTLYAWLQAQKQSNHYDDYHALWIDETLQFVYSGAKREFSVANWVALLDSKQAAVGKQDSKVVSNLFFDATRLGTGYLMSAFLVDWLKQPGGMGDLTSSLYVLFGPR